MEFKVGVGKSDFAELRESKNYYVDKSELIYELVSDTDNKVTLFTRPRRFGKTLMMSIMIIMRTIIMLSLQVYLSEEDTKWNPTKRRDWDDRIFCLRIGETVELS